MSKVGKLINKVTRFHDKIDPLGKKVRDPIEDALGVPRSGEIGTALFPEPDTSALEEATRLLGAMNEGKGVTDWGGVYKAYASEKATLETEMSNAMGREKAIMAAGGLTSGSEGWNQRLGVIEADYGKKISGLRAGSTFTALQDYYKKSGGSGDIDAWLNSNFKDIATIATRDASAAGDTAAKGEIIGSAVQKAAAMTEDQKRKTAMNPWLA